MNSLIAATVFVTIYFTSSSYALQCYDCIYYDGFEHSDDTCQNSPSASLLNHCADAGNSLLDETPVCMKVSGLLDGKPAVVRNCGVGLRESVGKCEKGKIRIGKRFTDDAYGCTCSGEKCNGATVATFSWAATVAIAVLHTFYKIMSVGGQ